MLFWGLMSVCSYQGLPKSYEPLRVYADNGDGSLYAIFYLSPAEVVAITTERLLKKNSRNTEYSPRRPNLN